MAKKLTKQEFENKADAVHGGKYDYSLVVYENTRTKVDIVCPVHGVFHQTPMSHLAGNGCPECGKESSANAHTKWTKDSILKAAKECESYTQFRQCSAYSAAQRLNLLSEIPNVRERNPRVYWTPERCIEAAKTSSEKGTTRKEFKLKFSAAWRFLITNNMLDDYFVNQRDADAHMHCVYVYLFNDDKNTVYVGRTLMSRKH